MKTNKTQLILDSSREIKDDTFRATIQSIVHDDKDIAQSLLWLAANVRNVDVVGDELERSVLSWIEFINRELN